MNIILAAGPLWRSKADRFLAGAALLFKNERQILGRGSRTGCELRRQIRLRRALHGHLLPAVLPFAPARPRTGRVLPAAGGSGAGGLPSVPRCRPNTANADAELLRGACEQFASETDIGAVAARLGVTA